MSNRSGGAATLVDGAAEAAAKSAHAESPTRQEFELQQRRIEEQERRIEEQQRQIDNLIKMVSSLGEGLPAIGADILKGTGSGGQHTTKDDNSTNTGTDTDLAENWSRHFNEAGEVYYYNEMTGDQWENPMTEHAIADEQSSLDKTSSNPTANRRGSRRRSSFIKIRRRSSVKAALNNVAQKEPGESTAQ